MDGRARFAGGEKHEQLLKQAKRHLEENGFQVNLLYQDRGEDEPDGHVVFDDTTAHLEAEHTTLIKPAKVLQNLCRGHRQSREVIFAVEHDKATEIQNVLSDPVNRRGADHEDTDGTYSYDTDKGGNPVTDADQLQNADYRIIEVSDGQFTQHDQGTPDPDCPELDSYTRKELENFCLYRENDGHCTELGQPFYSNCEGPDQYLSDHLFDRATSYRTVLNISSRGSFLCETVRRGSDYVRIN